MAQVMALDYGGKRCGLAATDDLQLIASGLDTVATDQLFAFFQRYFAENEVETLVVGLPTDLKGQASGIEVEIQKFLTDFSAAHPQIIVERLDERFTSRIAAQYISQSGKTRKARQDKGLVDKVSATLLLQNFLDIKKR